MEIDIAIVNFYVIMIGICSALSSLVTEAIKITAKNAGKKWSSNLIALIDAVVVGGGVPIIFYIYNDIPFNLKNIVTIICLIGLTWIGSTVGFDKVKQMFIQLFGTKTKEVKEDTPAEEDK